MPAGGDDELFGFTDEDVGWDDPRPHRPSSARTRSVQRRSAARAAEHPPAQERARPARRQRRPRRPDGPRTLAGDLLSLRDAVARRPSRLLAVLGLVAAGVALVLVVRSVGGGSGAAPKATAKPPARTTPRAALPGLRRGKRSTAVRQLQESLAGIGLYPGAVDAIYGPATETAVTSFQRSDGLTATGVADATTVRELGKAVAERVAPESATVRRGLAAAVGSGRLSSQAASRDSASLTLAATEIGHLGGTRGATLSVVLHDVAAQTSRYDEPRALALFGMLDANRRYLARNAPTSERQDIEDADGVVYRFYTGHGFQFQPLANFARLNALVTQGDAAGAHRLATALAARGIPNGDALRWEYFFPFKGPTHWISGLAQAVAAQSLARTADLVHDPALKQAAYGAFRTIPEKLSRPLGGGIWIREYSFTDIAILNAQLQSLVSLTDYDARTTAADVHRVVLGLDLASRTLLPQFDTGCWSRYQLGGNDADLHYHTYHVQLLRQLTTKRGSATYRTTGDRWARFLKNRALPCGSR